MIVQRAHTLGFCFGVRNALRIANTLPDSRQVTIHGHLVHNEAVLRRLAAQGFTIQGESAHAQLPPSDEVLITAHGLSDWRKESLRAAGKRLIDTTCPLVTRLHRAAQRLHDEGYFVVVAGKRDHVEVRGVIEDLEWFMVVESASEVERYDAERIGVVYQTTTSPSTGVAILAAVQERNPGAAIRSIDTICQPTRDRQAAVLDLAGRVDVVVVVGGRNSNNTREQAALVRSRGVPCIHVQCADDLEPRLFRAFHTAGLAGGTSTPDDVIDEVEARLRSFSSEEESAVAAGGMAHEG